MFFKGFYCVFIKGGEKYDIGVVFWVEYFDYFQIVDVWYLDVEKQYVGMQFMYCVNGFYCVVVFVDDFDIVLCFQ